MAFIAPLLIKIGSRVMFKEDGKEGYLNLGPLQSVTPNFNPSTTPLYDSGDTGNRIRIGEIVDQFDESYDVVVQDLRREIRRHFFLAGEASKTTTATATTFAAAAKAVAGRVLGVIDGTGSRVYGLAQVIGILKGSPVDITPTASFFDRAAQTITFSADVSGDLSADDYFIVKTSADLEDPLNARTYQVASVSTDTVTVKGGVNSTQTGGTPAAAVASVKGAGGSDAILVPGTDYKVLNRARGHVEIATGGVITNTTDGEDVTVVYATAAGDVYVAKGQSALTGIEGEAEIWFVGDDGKEHFGRLVRMSITPNGSGFSDESASTITLTLAVLGGDIPGCEGGSLVDFRDELSVTCGN